MISRTRLEPRQMTGGEEGSPVKKPLLLTVLGLCSHFNEIFTQLGLLLLPRLRMAIAYWRACLRHPV